MRNKKIVLAVFVSILTLFVIFFGYKIYEKINSKEALKEKVKSIPFFELQTLEGVAFKNEDLEQNKNSLFVFFDSNCEICQIEGKAFSKTAHQFHSTHIYFISNESIEQILKFQKEKNLKQTNITFLQDDGHFSSNYDVSSVPFICFYNKKDELVKIYKGAVNPKLILEDAEGVH